MFRPAVRSVVLGVALLFVLASVVSAAPSVTVQIVPQRPGPTPYPVAPEYPFGLTAKGAYLLDEKTTAALSAGEASLTEAYAWTYDPATADLSPDGSSGSFLYSAKFEGTRQKIAVTYTVTVTWLQEDRAAEEYAATDALDVLVLYSGGGAKDAGGGADLYVYPPDQNGQVCDMITVYAKVYTPDVFSGLEMFGLDGQWHSMGMGLVEATEEYTLWCCGWSTGDVPGMKNTAVAWRVLYHPPGESENSQTGHTWTRHNTVVQCLPEKVLKWDPDDEDNCDTGAAFTIDHLNYGSPNWKVTVKVYNAEGTLLKTLVQEGGFQVGENSVTWDGSLEPPPLGPGGTAPKGLYAYTVEADHTVGGPYYPFMCKDHDKSETLYITNAHFTQWQVDWDGNWQVHAKVAYTLSQAAQSAQVRVFGPNLELLYTGQGQPTTQGQHETDEFTFSLPEGDDALGTYTVVVDALETAAVGAASNRDGQPKGARQGLGTSTIGPRVDLDIGCTTETTEETSGGVLLLNNDDDNQSHASDLNESPVTGEDNLGQITLYRLPSNLANSQIKLEDTSAVGGKIKVWTTSNKGTEVTLPATWAPTSMPTELYVEGHALSTAMRDVTLTLSYIQNGTQVVASDSVKATVISIGLKQVGFSGTGYHDVASDTERDQQNPPQPIYYTAPHWQDNTTPLDGDADDTGDRKWPVCYERAKKVVASVLMKVLPDFFWNGSVKIKGEGSAGLEFDPAEAGVVNGDASATLTSEEALPNYVHQYPFADPLYLNWYISRDNGTSWFGPFASGNETFVTLAAPQCSPPFRTVLKLATENGGGTDFGSALLNTWDSFESPGNNQTPTGLQAWNESSRAYDIPLTYYAGSTGLATTTAALLTAHDGECLAFARLFMDCCRANPRSPLDPVADTVSVKPPPEYGSLSPVVVKSIEIYGATYGGTLWPYSRQDWAPSGSIPGQNSPEPAVQYFGSGHWIVGVYQWPEIPSGPAIFYLDPSYGVEAVDARDYTNAVCPIMEMSDENSPYYERWRDPNVAGATVDLVLEGATPIP